MNVKLTKGNGCSINKDSMIGYNEHGAVIGAGSVVTCGYIPKYEIWAGNPAKYLKKNPECIL